MGDEHDGAAALAIEGLQQFDDPLAGRAVEVAGGLVGEENAGLVHEGAGQRHALLLAARKLLRKMVRAIAQPHTGKQVAGAAGGLLGGHRTGELERHLHVFERGQRGNQLEALEHEADLFATQLSATIFVETSEFFAVERHCAL